MILSRWGKCMSELAKEQAAAHTFWYKEQIYMSKIVGRLADAHMF